MAARWGLVPFWAKDLKVGYKMINARNDRLLESKAYAPLVKKSKNRCLIVADGFYEWLKAEKPKEPRQPVRFTVDGGEPFAFAGLTVSREWEGEPLTSCTIITTDANDVVSRVHDRMPVILPNEEAEQAWLTGELEPGRSGLALRAARPEPDVGQTGQPGPQQGRRLEGRSGLSRGTPGELGLIPRSRCRGRVGLLDVRRVAGVDFASVRLVVGDRPLVLPERHPDPGRVGADARPRSRSSPPGGSPIRR